MGIIRSSGIGIFSNEQLSREGLVKLLSDDFKCTEIEKWENVESSTFKTLILLAPERMYPEVSFELMTETIERYKGNVILINNDKSNWWIYRTRFEQLRNPSLELVKSKLKMLHAESRSTSNFFGRLVRA